MPQLTNVRQERFAQAMANGLKLEAAHREAGYNGDRGNAAALAKKHNISQRIAELQAETAKTEAITREEVIQFLADAVKTPAGHVHKGHPLCQSFKDTADCTEIKTPDKLGAIGQLLKMIPGWAAPEKVESTLEVIVRKM